MKRTYGAADGAVATLGKRDIEEFLKE